MHSSFHSLNHLNCGLCMGTANSLHVIASLIQALVLNLIFLNINKFFSEQVVFCFVLMCVQRADAVENVIKLQLQMHRVLLLNVSVNTVLKYYFRSCLLLPQTSISKEPSQKAMLRITKFNLRSPVFEIAEHILNKFSIGFLSCWKRCELQRHFIIWNFIIGRGLKQQLLRGDPESKTKTRNPIRRD